MSGEAESRITNAAIGVADAFSRFEREFARLQRSIADADLPQADVTAAVNRAVRGRPDRQEALRRVLDRLASSNREPSA